MKQKKLTHVITDKPKLVARIRRIKGQVESIEKAVSDDGNCEEILLTIASIRGALMGLMGDLMEGHVMHHLIEGSKKSQAQQMVEIQNLIKVVKTFVK